MPLKGVCSISALFWWKVLPLFLVIPVPFYFPVSHFCIFTYLHKAFQLYLMVN